jgi:prephenate dehydratase
MLFSEVTLSDIERVIPLVERPLADIGIVPWDNTAFGEVEADVAAESLGA